MEIIKMIQQQIYYLYVKNVILKYIRKLDGVKNLLIVLGVIELNLDIEHEDFAIVVGEIIIKNILRRRSKSQLHLLSFSSNYDISIPSMLCNYCQGRKYLRKGTPQQPVLVKCSKCKGLGKICICECHKEGATLCTECFTEYHSKHFNNKK